MAEEIKDTKNLDIELETHIFTCVKYKDSPDAGFSANLYLLTEAVQHSDKVTDENIKLIAKGLLASVMYHKIQKHDMDEVNKKLEDHKKTQAKPSGIEVVPE